MPAYRSPQLTRREATPTKPDGGEGQEGGPAAVPLLEEGDGALGVLLPVHHDVLQAGPQGHLQGHRVPALGPHEAGHRAVDAPQAAPSGGLHHHAHRLAEPLVLLLHLREHPHAGFQVVSLHGQLDQGLPGGPLPPLAALHAQGVSLDDVGGGIRILSGVLQGPAGGFGLPAGGLQLGLKALQLTVNGPLPLLHLLQTGAQGGQALPALGGSIGGQGLPSLEGADLPAGAAGALGGLPGLLPQLVQGALQRGGLAVQLRQTGRLALQLLPGGPAAAVHVSHDLSPPSGPGNAAGADLSGISDQRWDEVPQIAEACRGA